MEIDRLTNLVQKDNPEAAGGDSDDDDYGKRMFNQV